MDPTTPKPPRSISDAQAFARKLAYLWVWGVSQKLRTKDPHAILQATSESQIVMRLKDVRIALDIGQPPFEIPPLKTLHAAMLGQGDKAAMIERVVSAAVGSEQLHAAVHQLLGDDTPQEAGPVRAQARRIHRDDRLSDIEAARVVDPSPSGLEEEVARKIDSAVYLASRHAEQMDPPDALTDPGNPPSPQKVLELLTVDLVHGYYAAKRRKDYMDRIRIANMLIKASATRFAIERFSEAEGGQPGSYDNSRALPPISVAETG
jgi:hypothetical protein